MADKKEVKKEQTVIADGKGKTQPTPEAVIELKEFCQTEDAPIELRGGFLYQMQVEGHLKETRNEFRRLFKAFCKRPIG